MRRRRGSWRSSLRSTSRRIGRSTAMTRSRGSTSGRGTTRSRCSGRRSRGRAGHSSSRCSRRWPVGSPRRSPTTSTWSRPAQAATWPTRRLRAQRGRGRRQEADVHAARHTRLPARRRRVAHGPPPRRLPARGRHEAIRRGVTAEARAECREVHNERHAASVPGDRPDVYEHFMGRWSARLADPFLEFAGIKPGSTVLCWNMTLSVARVEPDSRPDASEPYLDGARRLRSHPDIEYELGDASDLQYASASLMQCLNPRH